ncbi:hypothetical protein ACQB6R_03215 [Propionibacteriaceae bacterium G1746]|uniref:hypothetical protein n=1 Tax=Aestuariimicrobium sp. G57 TaxID=3418485 RepID=UPI003C27C29E
MRAPRLSTKALAAAVVAMMLTATGCSGAAPSQPDAVGPRVQGTSISTGAPVLSSGDAWDELGAEGTDAGVRTYVIEREPGEDVVAAVNVPVPAGTAKDGFELQLEDTAGNRCDSGRATLYSVMSAALLSAQVASTAGSDTCLEAQRLVLTLRRSDGGSETLTARLRLTKVAGVEKKDWPTTEAEAPTVNVGESSVGTPGAWLSDAGNLTSGRTVSGEIGSGGTQTYGIPVQWGQGLVVKLVLPRPSPSVEQQLAETKVTAGITLVGPTGAASSFQQVFRSSGTGGADLTLDPVQYAQDRWAGQYTVVVTMATDKETTAVIPYQLIAQTYGNVDPALGPNVPMEVVATSTTPLPEPVLWTMLVVGVLLIIAGMAQVTMHRQLPN